MLMLLHRLNPTMDINVKEILPKGLPKVQDGNLDLQNKKSKHNQYNLYEREHWLFRNQKVSE